MALLLALSSSPAFAENSGGVADKPSQGDYAGSSDGIDPSTSDATLIINDAITGNAYGGYADNGDVKYNHVQIKAAAQNVYGASTDNGIAQGNVTLVLIENVEIGSIYGAYSGEGDVIDNSVTSDANVVNLYGAFANEGLANKNKVLVMSGNIKSAYGAYSKKGDVTENNLFLAGSKANITDAYGGYSEDGNAIGNSVNLVDSTVSNIYGGFTEKGDATANMVSLLGGKVSGAIIGGISQSGGDQRTGNTLYVYNPGLTASSLANFQHYLFYLPETIKANDVMLSVKDAVDISTPTGQGATTVGVGVQSIRKPINKGDKVTLIKSDVSLKADANMPNTIEAMQGISKAYEFSLETTDKELIAKVEKAGASDEAIRKSPAEGKAASVALVRQGSDLIAEQGMSNAKKAVASSFGLASFGAMNGGSFTYKTGSHVDSKDFSFMAGLAKRLPMSSADALLGAFFEAGWGSYDSYNKLERGGDIRAWGSNRYYGGGLLARLELTNAAKGLYAETSFRIGRLTSDYKSDDLNPTLGRASYDTNTTYYGAHAGLGYIWQLSEKSSYDFYGKYFWSHTRGNNVNLFGDDVAFDAVNSHRVRAGVRFNYAANPQFAPYFGLAWDYEFGAKANSTVAGESVSAPKFQGSTGMGEMGVSFKPSATHNFSIDLGMQGYLGKRQGVSGTMQLKYEF